MYKIEKNIPKPVDGKIKYPLRELEVGDSFFVPLDGRSPGDLQNSILGSARSERFEGKRFSTHVVKEDGKRIGIRCWRIK